MVYTEEEIYDEICKFVIAKPGRTINQVVEYIYNPKNKNMCAKQTAEDRVRELIGNRLTDNRSREGGFHSLHINDDNDFNKLRDRIEDVSEPIQKFIVLIRTTKWIKKDPFFLNCAHMVQLMIGSMVTKIAVDINDSIKTSSSREALNVRLVELLLLTNEVNKGLKDSILENWKVYRDRLSPKEKEIFESILWTSQNV